MIPDTGLQPSATNETNSVIQLLLSSDDDGRIPFPEGNSRQIAAFLRALSHLDDSGHIQRRLHHGYLTCYLTDSGKDLKAQAIAAQNEGDRCSCLASGLSQALGRACLLALAVGLFLSQATPLQARLGDSPARVEARYGAPVKFENGACSRDFQYTYQHDGFLIVVQFLDEKSQCECYSNENGDPLPADIIQRLMEVNGRGSKWSLKEDTESSKQWSLDSGDTFATEQKQNGHRLQIESSWWRHFTSRHLAVPTPKPDDRLKDF
ncbi:MAG: hypothetical protein P4L99_16535 [Chthoniobacter sp.]|nr:hypothetical protein [Chthoniobacter sp.]